MCVAAEAAIDGWRRCSKASQVYFGESRCSSYCSVLAEVNTCPAGRAGNAGDDPSGGAEESHGSAFEVLTSFDSVHQDLIEMVWQSPLARMGDGGLLERPSSRG